LHYKGEQGSRIHVPFLGKWESLNQHFPIETDGMNDTPLAPVHPGLADLARWIQQGGGGFVPAADFKALLLQESSEAFTDWASFEHSWDDLPADLYMGDGGTYRTRRYAIFSVQPGGLPRPEAHQPHYQDIAYNALNGGVARHFAPIADAVRSGSTLGAVLSLCTRLFGLIAPAVSWHIEVHQFRIQARAGEFGQPTPEGVHRDGVDFVLVMLVQRVNIASGTTTIHDASLRQTGSFTLAEACDVALLDDRRCYHGVTPVRQIDAGLPAYRDVLVVTFRKK